MSDRIEKIRVDMHVAKLSEDLECYRQRALELGATEARALKVRESATDESLHDPLHEHTGLQ